MPSRFRRRAGIALLALLILIFGIGNAVPALLIRSPLGDTTLSRFDVILVLGNPANPDGTPGAIMARRVEEGVALYRAGVAPHLLFTGGAAHNRFREALVMAKLARDEGVPARAIAVEPEAMNTYQNAFLCREILRRRGWRSIAVVTSAYHARRAGYIFSWYDLPYRVYPCDDGGGFGIHLFDALAGQREALGLTWLMLLGSPRDYHLTPEQRARASNPRA